MGHFVKVCGSVSGCFKLVNPKFANREGKSLGELCCRFLLIQADVPASSADTLANDVVNRLGTLKRRQHALCIFRIFPGKPLLYVSPSVDNSKRTVL